VIRQESLYRADAASSAGALGLMQLLPATAQATARKAGLPPPVAQQPAAAVGQHSARLGLPARPAHRRADGQQPLADRGLQRGTCRGAALARAAAPLETDVWVENIPFNETRAYVQRVHWHWLVFEWLEDRKPRDVSPWLSQVTPPPDLD
jgi:soluble lytic murein transglycosylase